MKLWSKGWQSWNKWILEHPEAEVDFSNMHFTACGADQIVSFENFLFPNGRVSFASACFGDGGVTFKGATFVNGNVSFHNAKFGSGGVNFEEVSFGQGDLIFRGASFQNGDISFKNTKFSQGDISFSRVYFGEGDLLFRSCQFEAGCFYMHDVKKRQGNVVFTDSCFGKGDKFFDRTNFGAGDIYFNRVHFGKGHVSFLETQFGIGDVSFSQANFYDGDVTFTQAHFEKGEVDFSESHFGTGDIHFRETCFAGPLITFMDADFGVGNVSFADVQIKQATIFNFNQISVKGSFYFHPVLTSETAQIDGFSLCQSTLEGAVTLDGKFNTIPDLNGSMSTHHVDLSQLQTTLKYQHTKRRLFGLFRCQKAKDIKDASKLRRLKEIAEENKDHIAAMGFHADEMRALRWQSGGRWGSVIDLIFDKASDYGQSLRKPLINIGWTYLIFSLIYAGIASLPKLMASFWPKSEGMIQLSLMMINPNPLHDYGHILTEAFLLSLGCLFSFLLITRETRAHAIEGLFGADPIILLDFILILQVGISFIFLFLLGLGMRNRFRL